MEIKNARAISPKALFERRKQAIMLFEKGLKRYEIAPVVGATSYTVGRWVKAWKEGGPAALKTNSGGRPKGSGRKLLFHEEQEVKRSLTDRCPDQLKLPFALWSRQAVQALIKEKFGVKMTLQGIGKYLKSWGFTPQKPIRRAYERNDAQVEQWMTEEYPAIAKKAKREGAEIHWGDETGLRSDDVHGRSYAPKGKTPVQRVKGTPEKLNMISTVTNRGQLRFMFYKETMTAPLLIKFMKRLIRSSECKIFLILDNLRVHHSKALQVWLTENKTFIEVFYLPSYSPDLNPDELLNSDLKSGLGKKPESKRKGELEKNAKAHMRSVQKRPQHIISFFQKESVRYAS
jgi:transposase